MRPIGPHSAVQNVADTTTARGDRPVLRPYRCGSIMCAATGSKTKNMAAVHSSKVQPGSTATASASGKTAETNVPIYGTKRRIAASIPHSAALGMPMIHKPVPITMPKPVFKASCDRKSRLNRRAASSSAAVVFCRS